MMWCSKTELVGFCLCSFTAYNKFRQFSIPSATESAMRKLGDMIEQQRN